MIHQLCATGLGTLPSDICPLVSNPSFLSLYRQWRILLTQNRNTPLPSPFYQDSLAGRSMPRPHTKHSFTQHCWCNPVAQRRSSLSDSCHTVLPLPWLRSLCLLGHCKLGATTGCKGPNEHRISSNQRLCLYLLIFPHTERSKKYLSLLELFFPLFSSIWTVDRPKCHSSSPPAHLRYWMCN